MSASAAGVLAGALVVALGARRPAGARRPRGARLAERGSSRGAADAARLGVALVAVSALGSIAILGVVPTAIGGVSLVGGHRGRRAVRRRRLAGEIVRSIPELVDLFVVAASAGHPVPRALAVVAPRSPAPVRRALLGADRRRARGLPLDAALRGIVEVLGPPASPLVDALRQSHATGTALGPLLHEVAIDARDARRRRAQEAARRLPVTMLLPLAGCILPAAVLLAVVPVLLVSLASLSG
jgi:Flp pilus assembly protein TadB